MLGGGHFLLGPTRRAWAFHQGLFVPQSPIGVPGLEILEQRFLPHGFLGKWATPSGRLADLGGPIAVLIVLLADLMVRSTSDSASPMGADGGLPKLDQGQSRKAACGPWGST